jgi:hypothetical protein
MKMTLKRWYTVAHFHNFRHLFLKFYHFCTHSHVYTLFEPPPTPLPDSGQTLFRPLILQTCWRQNIRDYKKDIAFFKVWNKGSCTERFIALLPCTCVFQPTLVHTCQTSSLLPSPLLTVALASLILLYSLLYSEPINHIQVLSFLFFLYSSHALSPLSLWPMSNNITALALGL